MRLRVALSPRLPAMIRAVFANPAPRSVSPRTPRRRKACWVLFTALSITLIIHATFLSLLETVRPEWRDPEFGCRLRSFQALQAEQPASPIVVALGSSRTQMAFSPNHMPIPETGPIVFNFGRSGSGPIRQLMILHRLLDQGIRPDAVIIEFMPATYHAETVEDIFDKQTSLLSHRDVALLTRYVDEPRPFWGRWAHVRLHSLYHHRMMVMSHLQPGWLPWPLRQDFLWKMTDRYGWSPYFHSSVSQTHREEQLALNEQSYRPLLQDLHIQAQTEQALRDMVRVCRSTGIAVALFLSPESPRFRSWYSLQSSQRCQAFLNQVVAEMALPIFDATDGFGEEAFVDGHHMLREGAIDFSQRLWTGHISPWLASIGLSPE